MTTDSVNVEHVSIRNPLLRQVVGSVKPKHWQQQWPDDFFLGFVEVLAQVAGQVAGTLHADLFAGQGLIQPNEEWFGGKGVGAIEPDDQALAPSCRQMGIGLSHSLWLLKRGQVIG